MTVCGEAFFQPYCRTQKYKIVQISEGEAYAGKSGIVPGVVTYQGKNKSEGEGRRIQNNIQNNNSMRNNLGNVSSGKTEFAPSNVSKF